MSVRMNKNKHFLYLLWDTNKAQALALLSTLSQHQTDLLSEIFFNIKNLPIKNKSTVAAIIKKRSYILTLKQLLRKNNVRGNLGPFRPHMYNTWGLKGPVWVFN
jgi:hypothetical protein